MMESKDNRPIFIVRKIVKKKQPHHGGAWKIAYADFVTAMMAFFLLMWLLSMLNKYQLMGISNYFNKQSQNVYVENQKNDTKVEKVPAEQTKKYKMVMTSKENTPVEAISRGSDSVKSADTKASGQGSATKNKNGQMEQSKLSKAQQEKKEKAELKDFMKKLENDFKNSKEMQQYKGQLTFQMMEDGIKVNLKELENKTMFSSGQVNFESYAKPILSWLSNELNQTNRKIMIIGHTDAHKYPSPGAYSNWELSADRANAARRSLIKYGMNPDKIIRIQGAADSDPIDKKFNENPINRRIEIIILTNDAQKKMIN